MKRFGLVAILGAFAFSGVAWGASTINTTSTWVGVPAETQRALNSRLGEASTDITALQAVDASGAGIARVVYSAPLIAAVNAAAGQSVIAGITGKKILVTNWILRAAGSAGTCTSVDIQDSNGTPVSVAVVLAAALTSGTPVYPGVANSSLGAGFGKPLTSGAGLVVVSVGTDCTTTTAIDITISYTFVDG